MQASWGGCDEFRGQGFSENAVKPDAWRAKATHSGGELGPAAAFPCGPAAEGKVSSSDSGCEQHCEIGRFVTGKR